MFTYDSIHLNFAAMIHPRTDMILINDGGSLGVILNSMLYRMSDRVLMIGLVMSPLEKIPNTENHSL